MRLVEDSKECVVDRSKKLLEQRAVNVREGVKGKRCRVVGLPYGRCFRASGSGQDDGRCAGIERVDNYCSREGGIDGGEEGEAQVSEGAASEVGRDGCGVGVKKLVHPLQHDVCCLAVDRRDVRVFEALDKLVDSGGRHGGGLNN